MPSASGGSFLRVTACYATGESGASNEAEEPARVPGPRFTQPPAVGANGITANGSGFTDQVDVFVDGIPSVRAAKVKAGNAKVKQKGDLSGFPLARSIRRPFPAARAVPGHLKAPPKHGCLRTFYPRNSMLIDT